MDPTVLTVAEASRAIAEGTLSPIGLTEAYFERIVALDGELHSYVTVLRDAALDAAQAAARDIAAGRSRGALHGIPIGLKDIYTTRGIRTTAGSRRYEHYVPEEDAQSWVKLRDAGAILLGKHETHEFAIGGPDSACLSRRRATRGTRRIILGGRRTGHPRPRRNRSVRLKLDENLSPRAADLIRSAGRDNHGWPSTVPTIL